jgi:hypothetical protein
MFKFPHNEIISLLDENLQFNLAESTSQDLMVGDILTDEVLDGFKHLRLGYGSSQGNGVLRSELAAHLKLSPEDVLLTNGAVAAIFLTTFVLCEAGDEVVTVAPNFPPTLDIVSALGARRRTVQLSFNEKYRLTAKALAESLSEKTKLIILVTPHNPSGVTIPMEEIKSILKLAKEKCPAAWLMIDETYREAAYGDEFGIESAAGLSSRIITTASFSKCHGAPGLRVGWLTCQSKELMKQLTTAKMNTVISGSPVDELLALEVFHRRREVLAARRKVLREAIELTADWAEQNSEYVEWVRPDAGALCCIRLRESVFDDSALNEFARQTRLHQLQLASGTWFGDEPRVFRLGFGYLPIAQFKTALQALSGVLRTAVSQKSVAV